MNLLRLQESATVHGFFEVLDFCNVSQGLDIETQSRHGWARDHSD